MSKKFIRLAALVLALSMIMAMTACGGKDKDGTTTLPSSSEQDTAVNAQPGDPTSAPADTTANNSSTNAADPGSPSEANPATPGNPTAAKPSTVAEIVAYFNASANKVKTDKPGYSLMSTNFIGKITSSSDTIESLIGKIVPMFDTKPTEGEGAAKGASHNNFPVRGQAWASKLSSSAVKSATCTDKGTYYEITINMNDEKLSDLPKDPTATNHGKVMNVLSADEVYSQTKKFSFIVKVTSFGTEYTGSYIKCNIDKATGNMTSATYYFSNIGTLGAKLIGKSLTAVVPFGVKEVYTIKY